MIRKIVSSFIFTLLLVSCQKEVVQPTGEPLPPQDIITDSTIVDSTVNLVGQTWVLTGYRIGGIGGMIITNDTLVFNTKTSYSYNGVNSAYSFYPTASCYNLTLNYTPYGNLSGSIYEGNLIYGTIQGLKFVDITMGSGNQTEYYLWLHKI